MNQGQLAYRLSRINFPRPCCFGLPRHAAEFRHVFEEHLLCEPPYSKGGFCRLLQSSSITILERVSARAP